jgi:hypothetical protein
MPRRSQSATNWGKADSRRSSSAQEGESPVPPPRALWRGRLAEEKEPGGKQGRSGLLVVKHQAAAAPVIGGAHARAHWRAHGKAQGVLVRQVAPPKGLHQGRKVLRAAQGEAPQEHRARGREEVTQGGQVRAHPVHHASRALGEGARRLQHQLGREVAGERDGAREAKVHAPPRSRHGARPRMGASWQLPLSCAALRDTYAAGGGE